MKLEDKINSSNLKVNDKPEINLNDKMINEKNEYLTIKINSKLTTNDSLNEINSDYNNKDDVLILLH